MEVSRLESRIAFAIEELDGAAVIASPIDAFRDDATAVAADGTSAIAYIQQNTDLDAVVQLRTAGGQLLKTFSANTAPGDQRFVTLAISSPADRLVVGWVDFGADAAGAAFIRIFNLAGDPLTAPIAVDTVSGVAEQSIQLAVASTGSIVVAWQRNPGTSNSVGVVRRFDLNSSPTTDVIELSGAVVADVAIDSAGRFAVASIATQTDGSTDVTLDTFSSSATPVGSSQFVHTHSAGNQRNPAMAANPAGGFLVVWSDESAADGSAKGIFGRAFTATGSPATSQIQLSTTTAGDQQQPDVAVNSAGYVAVIYRSRPLSSDGVFAKLFDTSFMVVADEAPIFQNTGGAIDEVSVALADDLSWRTTMHRGADLWLGQAGNILRLNGTAAADAIILSVSGGQVQSRINGTTANRGRGFARAVIDSGDASDTITVNAGLSGIVNQFSIVAGEGDDSVSLSEGDDVVDLGPGADVASLGGGDDYAIGGDGNDVINGNGGRDTLSAGAGRNTLRGDEDADRLNGSGGRDFLYGGSGDDRLYGNGGNDLLDGQANVDRLFGGDGDDTLVGGTSNDKLYGEAGQDFFTGGAGTDLLAGGDGFDFVLDNDIADQLIDIP